MSKNSPPLKILFVTPECSPWVKTGGLGEVSASLPAALIALGHDVRVLMPAYRPVRALLAGAKERACFAAGPAWPSARLLQVSDASHGRAGFELLLLDCPPLYDRPGGPYQDLGGQDHGDNARRFSLLSHVAAQLGSQATPWAAWRPDVVHCNDWPTALAPAYLCRQRQPAKSVMTIHNLAFQGLFPLAEAASLGLPAQWLDPQGVEYWGQLSFMKAGLQFADAITTVSPSYAREIQHEPLGFGLQGVLAEKASRLHGILNGIDTELWNPATDRHLPQRYDARTVQQGKRACKAALQQRVGLSRDDGALLFGLVSRLTEQKGIDLIVANMAWMASQGAQLAALGQGDAALEAALLDLAERYPQQVAVTIGFEEDLAHLIEAGADCFLMPSRFEPCGLNQMYSLAYGTLPLVRATGGLADSVVDEQFDPPGATGFVFSDPTAEALQTALQRAFRAFASPSVWLRMQQTAMAQSFDWRASAARYEALYQALLEPRAP